MDGGSSRDLVAFDVRKAGFGKGMTIDVDLVAAVSWQRVRARSCPKEVGSPCGSGCVS